MNNFEQDGLIPVERRRRILEILRQKKAVSVTALARELYINEATVRRDLNALARTGALSRTHGGAVLREGLDSEIPFIVRETSNVEGKKQIAETAAGFVRDGDRIFLDSSATTAFMIPHLEGKKDLKVVTNGAKALLLLSRLSGCEIYCLGGKLRENSLSLTGEAALQTLRELHFDSVFFSCRGVDLAQGLTDSNESEALLRRILIGNAKKSFLLAESGKLDVVSFCSVCPLEAVGHLVTDLPLSERWAAELKRRSVSFYY